MKTYRIPAWLAGMACLLPALGFAHEDRMHKDLFTVESISPECLEIASENELQNIRIQANMPTRYQENDTPVVNATQGLAFTDLENMSFGYQGLWDYCSYHTNSNEVSVGEQTLDSNFFAFTSHKVGKRYEIKHGTARCEKAAKAYLHIMSENNNECVIVLQTL